ncbi:hypothetical protein, partial [Salmonella enterica]|uniref:hypothetical protein n=1 Tax=Salmonella enterica TaxID=28901 RepID=UPI003462448F
AASDVYKRQALLMGIIYIMQLKRLVIKLFIGLILNLYARDTFLKMHLLIMFFGFPLSHHIYQEP